VDGGSSINVTFTRTL
jgi:hypothetical protein